MNVIFVEPSFPANQQEFPRALSETGATVIGIGEFPKESLPGDLRHQLSHYEQIRSVVDEDALTDAVRRVQKRVRVHRLEATVEAHILAAANVREACGIPGTSVRTAFLCRDKPSMKEVLREGGVPCADSTAASSGEEVREFVARVGFPVIVKPRAAAGASGTFRADDPAELEAVIIDCGVESGHSVAVEEYIEGHEGFYDTITIDGKVVHDFACHYYPNVLEAMRTRWISPQFITTNRLDSAPAYTEVKEMGRKVVELLGIETSATHMEWFFGPKGLKFSEIGCRPPGVGCWDLYSAGNEMDIYSEWAHAVVHGQPKQFPSRRYSAGIIALRPSQDGNIDGYEGVEIINRAFGEWILDVHLPRVGTPTQPVSAGYMANAWVRMRHPDYDTLREMLDEVGRTLKVRAA